MKKLTFVVLCGAMLAFGCGKPASPPANSAPSPRPTEPAARPELGAGTLVAPGIRLHEVTLPVANAKTVWVYLPDPLPKTKLPCIFIAPAGSRMYHGMSLGEGDRPEHLPYVKAGFAVVAYELEGPLPKNPTDDQALTAIRQFRESNAGLRNFRAALDFTLAKIPAVDGERLFTAGHSSAATESLFIAANEPRIRGCIAYAPRCQLVAYLGDEFVNQVEEEIPGYRKFLANFSPEGNTKALRCPVFLFHAADDSVIPLASVTEYEAKLKETNPRVTFVRVQTGDHYDSMIQQGIPAGIQWLRGELK